MNAASPAVSGQPLLILRLEGAALLVAALVGYSMTGASWWIFLVLFLAPDLSFAAYLFGAKAGAVAYNALHSTIGPILLALCGLVFPSHAALATALIWAAHVGLDRLLGYGLKYPSAFQATHLGRIGKV